MRKEPLSLSRYILIDYIRKMSHSQARSLRPAKNYLNNNGNSNSPGIETSDQGPLAKRINLGSAALSAAAVTTAATAIRLNHPNLSSGGSTPTPQQRSSAPASEAEDGKCKMQRKGKKINGTNIFGVLTLATFYRNGHPAAPEHGRDADRGGADPGQDQQCHHAQLQVQHEQLGRERLVHQAHQRVPPSRLQTRS